MKLVNMKSFVRSARGANMVEYIILVALVALLCMVGYKKFGNDVGAKISKEGDAVSGITVTEDKK